MTDPSGTIDYEHVAAVPYPRIAPEDEVSQITKDCFGTVISSLKKMKECVRCELLRDCRAINWPAGDGDGPPVVTRRPVGTAGGDEASGDPSAGTP